MDFETWWLLLLPAFFAAGWYAARWDLRQTIRGAKQLPETYFKGLNHLLHDEQDEALEALIEVVKQDPDTPELHFALGALFRRRGEADRAIRVHENLLARRDLTQEHRNQARFELGLDYIKAGLLDQAEAALGPLDATSLAVPAEEQRIQIAQSTRDWPLAIRIARALKAAGHNKLAQNEVHFHCNLAEHALAAKPAEHTQAKQHFDDALACNPEHPRVALLGLTLKSLELSKQAVPTNLSLNDIETVADRFTAYSPLLVQSYIKAALQHQASDRAQAKLAAWYSSVPSQDILLAGLDLSLQSAEPLPNWVQTALRSKPTLLTVEQWFKSRSTLSPSDMEFLREQLRALNTKSGRYICKNCGFKASAHYWHCPGCAHWESYSTSTDEH